MDYELLQLKAEDIDNCGVPYNWWQLELTKEDNNRYYVIDNVNMCNVFWMYMWYNKIFPIIKGENIVNEINNMDLQAKVIISEDCMLKIENAYLVTLLRSVRQRTKFDGIPTLPFTMNGVLFLYLCTVAVLIFYKVKFFHQHKSSK